jgi:hypothetical protein
MIINLLLLVLCTTALAKTPPSKATTAAATTAAATTAPHHVPEIDLLPLEHVTHVTTAARSTHSNAIKIPVMVAENPNVSHLLATAVAGDIKRDEAIEPIKLNLPHNILTQLRNIYLKLHAILPPDRLWENFSALDKKAAINRIVTTILTNVHDHNLVSLLEAANYMDAQPLLEALAWRYAQHLHKHMHVMVTTEIIKKERSNTAVWRNLAPIVARQYYLQYNTNISKKLKLQKPLRISMETLIAYEKLPKELFIYFPQEQLIKNPNMQITMDAPPVHDPVWGGISYSGASFFHGELFTALSMVATTTPTSILAEAQGHNTDGEDSDREETEEEQKQYAQLVENMPKALEALTLVQNINVNSPSEHNGAYSPLMRAVQGQHYYSRPNQKRAVANAIMLINAGADVHVTDRDGRTTLMWAARLGDVQLTQLLLDKGVDPRLYARFPGARYTALDYAEQFNTTGHRAVARLLIRKGAPRGAEIENPNRPD